MDVQWEGRIWDGAPIFIPVKEFWGGGWMQSIPSLITEDDMQFSPYVQIVVPMQSDLLWGRPIFNVQLESFLLHPIITFHTSCTI